jgi:hypothetical protein
MRTWLRHAWSRVGALLERSYSPGNLAKYDEVAHALGYADTVTMLHELYARGSMREIAMVMGVTKATVYRLIVVAGVARKPRGGNNNPEGKRLR